MRKTLLLSLALLAALMLSQPARAAWYTPVEWGVAAYYNTALDMDAGDLNGAGIQVHLASQLAKGDAFTLHLRLEALLGGFWDYGNGAEVALVPGLRLYFGAASFQPYLEGGIGPEVNALNIPELGTSFNFLSYGGLGVRFALGKDMNLEVGYRIRHISNAGMDERNHGVTSHQAQVGISFPF